MKCKDFEVCGNEADERFTMDYTDVEPGAYIHWCSTCGPKWAKVAAMLEEKLKDPVFHDKFKAAVDKQYN